MTDYNGLIRNALHKIFLYILMCVTFNHFFQSSSAPASLGVPLSDWFLQGAGIKAAQTACTAKSKQVTEEKVINQAILQLNFNQDSLQSQYETAVA